MNPNSRAIAKNWYAIKSLFEAWIARNVVCNSEINSKRLFNARIAYDKARSNLIYFEIEPQNQSPQIEVHFSNFQNGLRFWRNGLRFQCPYLGYPQYGFCFPQTYVSRIEVHFSLIFWEFLRISMKNEARIINIVDSLSANFCEVNN